MNLEQIERIIYDVDENKSIEFVKNCKDSSSLHVFMHNYNYEDGFKIPNLVILNKHCCLSTALSIFYDCEGYDYLLEKPTRSELKDWFSFIKKLYSKILNQEFSEGNIQFTLPLTKVQAYKLKKKLNDNELIFVTEISGEDLEIDL